MNIESMVIRLEELHKKDGVRQYIQAKRWNNGFEMIIYRNEYTIEFETLYYSFEDLLRQEIRQQSSFIFQNIDLESFSLREVERQFFGLVLSHWDSRNELQIRRDTILGWNYEFYNHYYENFDEIVKFRNLDAERKKAIQEYKDNIRKSIIEQLVTNYTQQLTENKIQNKIENSISTVFFHSTYAKQLFESRSEDERKRDSSIDLTLNEFEFLSKTALDRSIEIFQNDSKKVFLDSCLAYIKTKIDVGNSSRYSGSIKKDLDEYFKKTIAARDDNKIQDDNYRLITNEVYMNWLDKAKERFEEEYPYAYSNDGLEQRDDDFEEWNDDDFEQFEDLESTNSRYKKYGGYNDYDDDTIDDAFEGDPSNTWNVD
jgi:hypothetical protein